MAPEIYLRQPQTDKIDVWALGILFYEMTHFETPFKKNSLKEIQLKLEQRRLKFNRNFSKDFIDFIYEMLVFNPEERMSSYQLIHH